MSKELLKELGLLSDEPKTLGFVSTGSFALNKVISGKYDGGIPIGGITQITGESSTAKTVFLSHVFSEAQKKNYHVKIIDTENAYHPEFAESMGIDPQKLYYSNPETLDRDWETQFLLC